MACSYITVDDAKSFLQDVEVMMDSYTPSLLQGGGNVRSR